MKPRRLTALAAVVASLLAAPASFADVRLPSVFGSHMVLQRGIPIPVWGWAAPGEEVRVTFLGETAAATAGEDGRWAVRLGARDAGGPAALTVAAANTVVFDNVVVGEVWLCSGQSNMQWPLSSAADASNEVAAARFSLMRLFTVARTASLFPEGDATGAWQVCTPDAAASFSAVGYFFGREIHTNLAVPVGLINASWGGTRIEPWTPREALEAVPALASLVPTVDAAEVARQREAYAARLAQKEARRAEVIALEQNDAMARAMAAPELNTNGWKTMVLPNPWEKAGLPAFDGLVWFRKAVVLPDAWAGRDLTLRLGPIDEMDLTSFNGTAVGRRGSYRDGDVSAWDQPRVYAVPGALVRAGTNVLAVRVIDSGWAGGIWGAKPGEMRLECVDPAGTSSIPIAGDWLYQQGPELYDHLQTPVSQIVPTSLFNAMIHPLVPYGIRGAIWYQGEANVSEGMLYRDKMAALIGGWRARWGEGPFPFLYVQLAPYVYGADPTVLPRLWQAQKSALEIENTGMAVITDLGNLRDIHPRRKAEVGRRLALWALNRTYGKPVVCSGPLFRSMEIRDGAARLSFDHVGSGLAARGDDTLSWFELADSTGAFVRASARIEGDQVVVSSRTVPAPTGVRYGWDTAAEPQLMNREGLPASPFTTETSPP